MTLFKSKSRTRDYLNYKADREFAAKKLPAHPLTRYHEGDTWTRKYLATRRTKHAPTPINKRSDAHCCLTCEKLGTKAIDLPNRKIWDKRANVQWLNAQWFWDFGFTLDAGLYYDFGVGRSPDFAKFLEDKNYIFAYSQDQITPVYTQQNQPLLLNDGVHKALRGSDIHSTKLRNSGLGTGGFKGELCGYSNVNLLGAKQFRPYYKNSDIEFDWSFINIQSQSPFEVRGDILRYGVAPSTNQSAVLSYQGNQIAIVFAGNTYVVFKTVIET